MKPISLLLESSEGVGRFPHQTFTRNFIYTAEPVQLQQKQDHPFTDMLDETVTIDSVSVEKAKI